MKQRYLVFVVLYFFAFACGGLAQSPSLTGETNSTEAKNDYTVGPGDTLQLQVFGEADTLTLQRVSASGEVNVPMLGSLKLGGLTLRATEKFVESEYVNQGIFVKPQVIVSLQAYAPRTISVLGQVNKPERIGIPLERQNLGIIQLITLAGGFTRIAKTDSVKVIRTVNGKEQSIIVNVTAYLESNGTIPEFIVYPDDIVFVPERFI